MRLCERCLEQLAVARHGGWMCQDCLADLRRRGLL